MEMKRINSGRLRAVGYDPRARTLRVEFDNGSVVEHTGVGDEVWRRLSTSGAAWSYYRDNVEEEFSTRPVGASAEKRANPLDDLFRK
ncbi:MAG: KTSC domain-containing protein [Propionivibrio sp.]